MISPYFYERVNSNPDLDVYGPQCHFSVADSDPNLNNTV